MALDNGNNVNEEVEENKKNRVDLKSDFLKDFKNDIESKEENERIAFFDKIKNSNRIDSVIKNELNKNFNYSPEESVIKNGKKKYEGLDLDSISINDLKKLFSSDIISIENERKTLKDVFLNDYEIDENEYNLSILPEINKLSLVKIINLKKSPKERNEFLISVLGKEKLPLLKEKVNFFEKIPGLKEKVLDENFENRDKLENILSRLDSRNRSSKLGSTDIGALSDLLSLDFLENSFKKQIIQDFLPVISFKDAKNAGIDFNEKKQKEEIIKQVFPEEDIENIGLSKLVSSLKNDNIYLDTSKLLSKDENISKISRDALLAENIAKNFSEDFNISLDKIVEETKENGPQTLKSLSEELEKINKEARFKHLEKFSEGNIMEVSKKLPTGELEISYIKILNADDNKKELSFLEIGNGNIINLTQQGEGKQISYFEFLKNFQQASNTSKLDFFTEKDIEEKIKNPKSDLKGSDLELFTKDDINSLDDEKKQEYKDYYRENLEKDLEGLKDELEQSNGKENDNTLLKTRIEDLEKQIGDIDNLDDIELLSFLNFRKLVEKIDDIDPEGKSLGLEKGLILNSDKGASFEILGIDKENQTVDILSRGKKGNLVKEFGITYEDFFQACKEHKITRNKKILDFNNYIELKKIDDKSWENYELKDGNLVVKELDEGEENKNKKVEYLVSSDNDEIIKINNISGNMVTFQLGERKDIGSLDKKEKKKFKGDKGEVLYLDKTEYTFSINELDNYIKKYKLHPDWKVGKEHKTENPKDLQNKIKGSFLSRYLDRISVNELLAGGKIFIESIEETLKKGNDLHAAKMALSMGSFLPEEMKSELQIKVERQESEEMDKALEGLGKVESSEAIERIRKWLLNKDTPEFKKEAGLMFMISKYGLLYAKKPLGNKKGSFLWYEAFGGKINDELYLKVKADAEAGEPPISFTEEKLMYELLSKQCKESGGYNGIKRRGRLYKEYDGKISQGISDELEKGSKEAKAMRSFKDRNNGAKGEFKGGEFNNAIGKYKEAVNRGESLDKLNEFPFTILFSGGCYLLQEEQLNEFKNFTEGGFGGLLFTKFLSDTNGMKVFNQTVLDLSEKFEKKDPKNFSGMYTKAKIIFSNQSNKNLPLRDKMEKAEDFWGKYGKALTRTMLKLNNQDSTYVKTDKILLSEEKEFSTYNNTLNSYIGSADFSQEKIMNDQFSEQGVSGLSYKVFDDIGGLSADARFRNNEAAEKILNEITGEIHNTKVFNYSENNIENNNIKLLNLQRQLSFLFTYIKKNGGQSKTMQNMKEGSSYWGEFTKLGISNYIDRLKGNEFSINNLSKMDTPEVKKFIRGVAEDILSGNTQSTTISSSSLFDEIITGTKTQANNTVYEPNEEETA